MKKALRGASGVAIVLGLASSLTAWAQQTQTVPTTQPQTAPGTPRVDQTRPAGQPAPDDKLIITGSFLATTPEDAPKPVEVITQQDLEDRGSPSITEFVRTLNSAAPSSANVAATSTGAGILGNGFVPIDLRGQGANGTLVLMNGRRLSTTNGGAGADVNTIPTEALAAVEILKDGASATYGAGAVGGVINFRTRRDVDSPELTVSRTYYEGSKGAYDINLMTGWVGDNGNLLISLSKDGEDSMMATKRGFSTLPYALNPDGWALANLPQRLHRQSNFTTAQPTSATVGSGGGLVSASFNDFTSNADCVTLGGQLTGVLQGNVQPTSGATTPTACAFPLANVTELVSEYEQDQAYVEFNYDLSDTMELHFDMLWSNYDSTGRRPPSSGGATTRIADPSISSLTCTSSCMYIVPYSQLVYTATGTATATSVVNPFIADFNARQAGAANDLGPGGALLTSSNWRPYLFGGNPLFDDGLARSRVRRERMQFNVGVNGEFAGDDNIFGQFLNGVTYDFAAQWNEYIQHNELNGDWLASRLQDAIMGYGGPDCGALDRVATDYSSAAAYNRTIGIQSDTAPGTNGCLWFNPFQSNFQTSIFNGAANPNFPASGSPTWGAGATQAGLTGPSAFLNDPELLEWIWADRKSEVVYNSQTYDALFTGAVPSNVFEFPGGQIGWALGSQFRITERRSAAYADDDEELELLLQDCPYSHLGQAPQPTIPATQRPTSRGCAGDGTGNFFAGASPLEPVPGERVPGFIRSETLATFAEVQLPVLDNLNFSASLRNESFNGGSIEGTIWSVAGKWDITDEFYLRGSYGTNFRAEEALDAVPGRTIVETITDNTRFSSGYQYQRITSTQTEIGPEDDTTLNVGVGYSGEVLGGRLRLAADFFRIDIEEEVVTTLAGPVLDNVFVDGAPGDGTTGHQADCSARLIDFIQFDGGSCQQGTTTAADVFAVIAAQLNGPNFLTEGVDYSIDYSYPVFNGSAYVSATVTQNLTYEAAPFDVNGVVFDEGGDRLGYANTTRTGSASSKLRGNATIGWSGDDVRVNLRANYQDGYLIEEGATRTPIVNYPASTTANPQPPDIFSTYGFSKKDYIDYDFNLIYDVPFVDELELRLSVLNLTDRDPPPDQGALGVRTSMGNVRGRRIELGLKKVF